MKVSVHEKNQKKRYNLFIDHLWIFFTLATDLATVVQGWSFALIDAFGWFFSRSNNAHLRLSSVQVSSVVVKRINKQVKINF